MSVQEIVVSLETLDKYPDFLGALVLDESHQVPGSLLASGMRHNLLHDVWREHTVRDQVVSDTGLRVKAVHEIKPALCHELV